MKKTSGSSANQGSDSDFWLAVESEIENIDMQDFREFLEAQELPYEPRPEFRRQLKRHLERIFVKH